MKNGSVKIFVMNHRKNPNIFKAPGYFQLMTGAALNKSGGGGEHEAEYLKDDEGINISDRNETYAELTGHYWIWKNVDADVVGVVHYRRYFASKAFNNLLNRCTFIIKDKRFYFPFRKEINPFSIILNCNEIKNMFVKNQIYVKASINNKLPVQQLFANGFGEDFCKKVKWVISEKYPDYLNALELVLNSNLHYHCNMFIGKKEIMNAYWEWLFGILMELEKTGIDFQSYTNIYDKRYANMGELLFRVWIIKNNIPHKSLDVITLERFGKKMEKPEIYPFHKLFCMLVQKIVVQMRWRRK